MPLVQSSSYKSGGRRRLPEKPAARLMRLTARKGRRPQSCRAYRRELKGISVHRQQMGGRPPQAKPIACQTLRRNRLRQGHRNGSTCENPGRGNPGGWQRHASFCGMGRRFCFLAAMLSRQLPGCRAYGDRQVWFSGGSTRRCWKISHDCFEIRIRIGAAVPRQTLF